MVTNKEKTEEIAKPAKKPVLLPKAKVDSLVAAHAIKVAQHIAGGK